MKVSSLHVGINDYPRPNKLSGCVADLAPIQQFLFTHTNLNKANTRVLTDKQATRLNIMTGLQWLAQQQVDVAVFQYSGHGSRVRDTDGDEATGYDQAIVPVDFQSKGLILDDDLQLAYRKFPPQTRIVVIFDSCFSDKSDRGIINTIKNAFSRSKSRVLPTEQVGAEALRQTYKGRGLIVNPGQPRDVVLLAGCRDFETSADAYFGSKIGYRGAFTYELQRALGTLEKTGTYSSVMGLTRDLCGAQGFTQQPQLSGPADWLVLPIFT